MPGAEPAKLGQAQGPDKTFQIETRNQVKEPPKFAVWELEDFAVRGGRIIGRACDDLIGVASALAVMIELKRRRARVHVMAVISRAEEVGFHGALAAAANREIPKNALVISLETSRELPGVKMGKGVILRVGDRMSVFDSDATRFLAEVGAGLKERDKRFQIQRALMAGGTCEATAYQQYGYQTAGVCVALGNYHNGGPGNRVRAEYVSEADAEGMVELLVGAAEEMGRFRELVGKLPKRLEMLRREAEGMLRRTAE
jgi:endoglucanase